MFPISALEHPKMLESMKQLLLGIDETSDNALYHLLVAQDMHDDATAHFHN